MWQSGTTSISRDLPGHRWLAGVVGWDRDDQWHGAAETAYVRIINSRDEVVTSTLVLYECGNAASRRSYRDHIAEFRNDMQLSGRLIVPTENDVDFGWASYRRGEADNAGIVDQISFSIMRRLQITEVFTNDRHFRAAGFKVLF